MYYVFIDRKCGEFSQSWAFNIQASAEDIASLENSIVQN